MNVADTYNRDRTVHFLIIRLIIEPVKFFSDMGVKEQYDAQEVLLWLGY